VFPWQVNLCDPLVTHGPYVSALEMHRDKALYEFHVTLLYFTFRLLTSLTSTSAKMATRTQVGPNDLQTTTTSTSEMGRVT